MATTKKSNAYRGLIIWMLVLLALAAAACAGYLYTNNFLDRRVEENAQEVQEINAQLTQEYNAAMAELSSQRAEASRVDESWPQPAASGWDVVDVTAFPISAGSQVSVTRREMLQGGMLVINRWHAMPADLTDDLMVSISRRSREDNNKVTNIPTRNSSVLLMEPAVKALMALYQDARDSGLDMDNIIVDEGYRTMETQTQNWLKASEKFSSRYTGDKLTQKVLDAGTAYPGTSDFQSGMSVSLYNYKSGDKDFSNTPLHETEQGKWFYNNCWKYGLVFRFPNQGFPYPDTVDKSYVTGIDINLKVYRYVGEANAIAMHALDMCLEEYAEYLINHPHIAVFEDGQMKAEIYRLEGGYSDAMVTIPNGAASYTVSSDNLDGMVVAVAF